MIILSAIFFFGGIASLVYGIYQNNSITAQWTSIWQNGVANPGTIWIAVGVVLIIAGVILFLVSNKH